MQYTGFRFSGDIWELSPRISSSISRGFVCGRTLTEFWPSSARQKSGADGDDDLDKGAGASTCDHLANPIRPDNHVDHVVAGRSNPSCAGSWLHNCHLAPMSS